MFKDSFKFYKAKWPVPDFGDVLDFDDNTPKGIKELGLDVDNIYEAVMPGLKPVYSWKCYQLTDRPGLIFVRNPFTSQGERYWMTRCVRDYPKRPNVVNLNTKLFPQTVIDDWWSSYQNCSDKDDKRRMKIAMRWTTLGYHHDWDSKHYTETMKNKFPDDLAQLSEYFSKALMLGKYSAEAAIVNYYPIGTTLAGHTDHSESDLEAPLFSFSFGQTAIFLIGGTTKEEKPSALFLRSGDVVVMAKQSRLCYHAVPRVMKANIESWNGFSTKKDAPLEPPNPKKLKCEIDPPTDEWQLDTQLFENCADENFWSPFRQFVNDSRININVRQVLKQGQVSLRPKEMRPKIIKTVMTPGPMFCNYRIDKINRETIKIETKFILPHQRVSVTLSVVYFIDWEPTEEKYWKNAIKCFSVSLRIVNFLIHFLNQLYSLKRKWFLNQFYKFRMQSNNDKAKIY